MKYEASHWHVLYIVSLSIRANLFLFFFSKYSKARKIFHNFSMNFKIVTINTRYLKKPLQYPLNMGRHGMTNKF